MQEKPKVIIGGASAYPRLWDFARMRQIADKVGAYLHLRHGAHCRPGRGRRASFARAARAHHHDHHAQNSARPARRPDHRRQRRIWRSRRSTRIDVFPGQQGGPLMHIVAAKAVAFAEALRPEFRTYAAQIVSNAKALAEALQAAGFRLVSGGTDNHLMLVDVFEKGILGSEAELALGKAGITVNKNSIPWDTNPPLKPSGIRVGTPALTTRGMKEPEMRTIAAWIAKALEQRNDDAALERIRGEVAELANQFPLYAWRARSSYCERITTSNSFFWPFDIRQRLSVGARKYSLPSRTPGVQECRSASYVDVHEVVVHLVNFSKVPGRVL